MIEIRHKTSGAVLAQIDTETLRRANFFERDLTGADFRNVKLSGVEFALACLQDADLSGAQCLKTSFYSSILRRANLTEASLGGIDGEGADIREAILYRAQAYAAWFRHASLSNADLREIDLKAANLTHANLHSADLAGADLTETIFQRTNLVRANLAGATFNSTIFAECTTLHKAQGPESVIHNGPSSLDQSTLRACVAHLPDIFLQGVGCSDEEIQSLRKQYPES